MTVVEGSSASYDIKLTQQPSADVTLTVTATGNTDVKLSTTDSCSTMTLTDTRELTFTMSNYDENQQLTVCGAEDYDASNDEAELSYSAADGGYGSLSYPNTPVTVTDNDVEMVSIDPTSLPITEVLNSVATGTYEVSLSAAPTGGSVTFTIEVTGDQAVSVDTDPDTAGSQNRLTFAPSDWDMADTNNVVSKEVTVSVAEDSDATDETAELTHTLSGRDYGTTTVGQSAGALTVNVNDESVRGVDVTAADPITFAEGGSATYTVKLDTEPSGEVTIAIVDTDTTDEIRVDETSLTFDATNWNVNQTVTVSATRDADAVEDTGTIDHEVKGADYSSGVTAESVNVTVTDGDTPGVTITPLSLTVGEGVDPGETYTVVLDTQPAGGNVTVRITSSNAAEVTASPSTMTFTADDWNDADEHEVEVKALQEDNDSSPDDHTLTHAATGADYGGVTAADVTVRVLDDDSPSFTTSTTMLEVTEGTSSSYTVQLVTAPVGGDVTITITAPSNSSEIRLADAVGDPVAELQLTFTSGNFNQAQTVTVLAEADDDALVDSGTITHVASGANFGRRGRRNHRSHGQGVDDGWCDG